MKSMRQVIKQVKERNKIDLYSPNVKYQLWRLDNDEDKKLSHNCICLKEDKSFHGRTNWLGGKSENKLNLAELFTTLEYLLGESSDLFDYDRGSFYFPLLIVLNKEIDTLFYKMDISDSKGYVRFRIYKILNNNTELENDNLSQSEYESEFSQQERNDFLNLFYNYLIGCSRILPYIIPIQPFINTIDAAWITYGYRENEYFEQAYNTEKAYMTAIKSFEEVYGGAHDTTDIDAVLQSIINSTQ